ncbi:DUF2939 domain-containing protein [Rufibacter glacialis]|uniref:DUF2939 domain-containing protein n=1 Tax=Rufibacter glacialis TaxID=1259555 RepID=A0A5M8QUQ4_9BACT|nr:DUF2939 domain-containing protein [Rufibacter glacialis]KAA6438183.1 DUF2939 domain-containing protein [Rufibacter glacialis]GGK89301.1 hypothetical protein GCM10011405_41330 [Rufibacter glacialis]
MKKVLLLLVVVALCAGGYWFYNRAKTGPEASLVEIRAALEAKDMARLEKYVDFKRTSASLVEQSQNMAIDLLPQELQGAANLLRRGLKAKKQLTSSVRNQLIQSVETVSGQKVPEVADVVKLLPIGKLINPKMLPNLEFEGIDHVNRQDSISLVGLKVRPVNSSESMVVELRMLQKEDYWQVVGVENFAEVLPKLISIGKKNKEQGEGQ